MKAGINIILEKTHTYATLNPSNLIHINPLAISAISLYSHAMLTHLTMGNDKKKRGFYFNADHRLVPTLLVRKGGKERVKSHITIILCILPIPNTVLQLQPKNL